ncbi:MAG: hypothetical protein IJ501_04975 [Bacilli bacterium]|nr:hypothetical protein [Bacilli bacterium]
MQGNITVLGEQKFYDNSALFKTRKPAKLSTYKTFYKKTTELQNSVRREKQELSKVSQNDVKQEIQTPFVETPVQSTPLEVNKPVETPQQVNNVVNFPSKSKEFYQASLDTTNATCFINSTDGNIVSLGHRRLKTNPVVPENTKEATKKVGVEYEVPVVEKQEEPVQQPFDFSNVSSLNDFSTPIKEEPKYTFDKEKRLDTILAKEVQTPVVTQVDNTGAELAQAKKDYEIVAESLETQFEIQSELERELEELKRQRVVKIEEYKQKTLAKTQNLHDVLATINQLKDAINEEKKALGMLDEEEYKKASNY